MVENVARMAGMPVGPLALNDETALDLGLKIVRAAEADLGRARSIRRRRSCWKTWSRNTAASAARTARASTITRRSPSACGQGLADLLPKKLSREEVEALDVEELKHRILVTQALEAARVFEEKVVTDVREADVGSILGWGFAPWSGGTLSWIDMVGTKKFVELCRALEKKHGARFKPNKLLLDMAESNDTFYRRFAPPKRERGGVDFSDKRCDTLRSPRRKRGSRASGIVVLCYLDSRLRGNERVSIGRATLSAHPRESGGPGREAWRSLSTSLRTGGTARSTSA